MVLVPTLGPPFSPHGALSRIVHILRATTTTNIYGDEEHSWADPVVTAEYAWMSQSSSNEYQDSRPGASESWTIFLHVDTVATVNDRFSFDDNVHSVVGTLRTVYGRQGRSHVEARLTQYIG